MLRVIGCVTEQHEMGLVVLAGMVCFASCFTALHTFAQARVATSARSRALLFLSASAVAGTGIWATHFIAMLAYMPNMPVGYDLSLTVLSVFISVAGMALGFGVGRGETVWHRSIGGAIAGLGVGAMHYTGMAAMTVPGDVSYDAGYVIASIALGCVLCAASAAMPLLPGIRLRLLRAGGFAVAICSLHFTGMAAVEIFPNPLVDMPVELVDPYLLAIGVGIAMTLVVLLGFMGVTFDRILMRRAMAEMDRLRGYVGDLEATKADLTRALDAAAAGSQAKTQFLATMSHELRTPLNAVIGYSEMLRSESHGPHAAPEYRAFAEGIHASGTQLLSLINDILDYSRLDARRLELQRDTVDVVSAVEAAVRALDDQARAANVAIRAIAAPDLPDLLGDARRVRQILGNLASNAVKFTRPGGQVIVSADMDGGTLVVTVHDTGIGMTPAQLACAVEPFGQAEGGLQRRYEGTGLGLPLARRLTLAMGGDFSIESESGEGTVVTLRFPSTLIAPPVPAARAA